MSGIVPCNSNHAILGVKFSVELNSSLDANVFQKIIDLYPKFRNDFPRKKVSSAVTIPISIGDGKTGGPNIVGSSPTLAGVTFDRLKPNGETDRSIVIQPTRISLELTDYTRWDETWAKVKNWLRILLNPILEVTTVKSFSLVYLDRFIWEGNKGDFKADLLFQKETPFIVANVFTVNDLWHSHHGYFEVFPEYKQLNNININVLDRDNLEDYEGSYRIVEIQVSHTSTPNSSPNIFTDVFGENNEKGKIDDYMERMHNLNKGLLRKLLTDDVLAKIQLSIGD